MTAPAKIKHSLPPRTAKEVFEMLPEGTLAEVIDNTIYMSPSPNYYHQDITSEIVMQIRAYVKERNLGKCLTAPMDVYLDDNNIVQPDILFLASANIKITEKGKIAGAPDLIVEVLSSNRNHDLEKKKSLYEKFGVKEYFVVDPKTKDVFGFYHNGQKYIAQAPKKGKLTSKLLKKTFTF